MQYVKKLKLGFKYSQQSFSSLKSRQSTLPLQMRCVYLFYMKENYVKIKSIDKIDQMHTFNESRHVQLLSSVPSSQSRIPSQRNSMKIDWDMLKTNF